MLRSLAAMYASRVNQARRLLLRPVLLLRPRLLERLALLRRLEELRLLLPVADGTLAPFARASESPIAIACFRLVTRLPLRPLRSVPCFRSLIARSTDFFEASP